MSNTVRNVDTIPGAATPLLQVRDLKMRAAAWAWSASPAVASRRPAG
jgi:hypothetical protein